MNFHLVVIRNIFSLIIFVGLFGCISLEKYDGKYQEVGDGNRLLEISKVNKEVRLFSKDGDYIRVPFSAFESAKTSVSVAGNTGECFHAKKVMNEVNHDQEMITLYLFDNKALLDRTTSLTNSKTEFTQVRDAKTP